jgi:uncharacterized protein YjeT (DUF2065 family)
MADLVAALALVLVIEGLATAIMAPRLPEILEALRGLDPGTARWTGLVLVAAGTGLYLLVRG